MSRNGYFHHDRIAGRDQSVMTMTNTTLDLVPLIRSGDFAALREELVRWRPRELAEAIGELTPEDQVIAFRILPRRPAAAVFEYMAPAAQRALVKAMGQEQVAICSTTWHLTTGRGSSASCRPTRRSNCWPC
jgi:Mg/Co/Ni transporter MgtE